ncbi:MAG: hypothetical protein PUI85_00085 [Eubacteriales bacterium]|nr:hypothetical protein [Eubacteriales bacterium]MDY3332218.1 hypothetical protein [Gallibacter sp.]
MKRIKKFLVTIISIALVITTVYVVNQGDIIKTTYGEKGGVVTLFSTRLIKMETL